MARILVAEDEPDIMALIALRLEREGHELIRANDGVEALQSVIDEQPDLAVLDWMMPGLTGVEVCAALRAHPEARTIRVIMLTARAQESDLQAAFDAGVDEYLIKPFRPGELQDRVAALLSRA